MAQSKWHGQNKNSQDQYLVPVMPGILHDPSKPKKRKSVKFLPYVQVSLK